MPRTAGPVNRAWRRVLMLGFFALVAVVVVSRARAFDWGRILHTLEGLNARTIAIACALTVASYFVYSLVDLFARGYAGLRLSRRLLMAIAFVCYAFNQNLGSLVGSVGFRFRLYSRFGVEPARVGGIVGLSLVTNWSGYFLVAGVTFLGRFAALPRSWALGSFGLQVLGGLLLATVLAYLGLCAFARRRTWHFRGRSFELPGARTALAQVALSSANWLLMCGVVFVLLRGQVPFTRVMAVFFVSAIAGAATHVPAGLGVIEAVFLTLLHGDVPRHEIIASLLAYRGIYYLGPLGFAAIAYALLEARARRVRGAREHGEAAGGGATAMHVTLRPGARESVLEGPDAQGRWIARLRAPPGGGRANAELITLVARHFACSRARVSIEAGGAGRTLVHVQES